MSEPLGWLSDRQRDGGVDEVALPGGIAGRLRLCGKHAIWNVVQYAPADVVVCLVERHEIEDRYPDYVAWLDRAEDRAIWWPIPDLHAPPADSMLAFVDRLVDLLQDGNDVVIHCAAGIGRTGTTAACVLTRLGMSADEALAVIADARPMAGPEVGAQSELVATIADR
jgi:protein-tyrosine phosphatase